MWYLKRFYAGFYSRHKTFWDTTKNREKKVSVSFFFQYGIGTGRVKFWKQYILFGLK